MSCGLVVQWSSGTLLYSDTPVQFCNRGFSKGSQGARMPPAATLRLTPTGRFRISLPPYSSNNGCAWLGFPEQGTREGRRPAVECIGEYVHPPRQRSRHVRLERCRRMGRCPWHGPGKGAPRGGTGPERGTLITGGRSAWSIMREAGGPPQKDRTRTGFGKRGPIPFSEENAKAGSRSRGG